MASKGHEDIFDDLRISTMGLRRWTPTLRDAQQAGIRPRFDEHRCVSGLEGVELGKINRSGVRSADVRYPEVHLAPPGALELMTGNGLLELLIACLALQVRIEL